MAVRADGRILGSVPMQHFVRLYATLAGMTATAESSADEFHAFFALRTVAFPPHRTCARVDAGSMANVSRVTIASIARRPRCAPLGRQR
jgi:preprotein translocase subunit SecA